MAMVRAAPEQARNGGLGRESWWLVTQPLHFATLEPESTSRVTDTVRAGWGFPWPPELDGGQDSELLCLERVAPAHWGASLSHRWYGQVVVVLTALVVGVLMGKAQRTLPEVSSPVCANAHSNATAVIVDQEGGSLLTVGLALAGLAIGYTLGRGSSLSSARPSETPETVESADAQLSEPGDQESLDPIEAPSSQEGVEGGGDRPLSRFQLRIPTNICTRRCTVPRAAGQVAVGSTTTRLPAQV